MGLSRRTLLLSAVGMAVGGTVWGADYATHHVPPRDADAEAIFRRLQNAQLQKYGVSAEHRQLSVEDPHVSTHVIDSGQGDPVLMLHGGRSVAVGFLPLLGEVAKTHHVYAPDRPGCGLSDKFDYRDVAFRDHAVKWTTGVMDGLGLPRTTIIANSMGGYFALVFALAHPERVSRLMLIGEPAGSSGARDTQGLIAVRGINGLLLSTVMRPSVKSLRTVFEKKLMADARRVPEDLLECLAAGARIPGAVASWLTMVENVTAADSPGLTHALRSELSTLTMPVRFMWGDKDIFGSPALGQEMAALMPHAHCDVVSDAGHLVWLDQPQQCLALTQQFLA